MSVRDLLLMHDDIPVMRINVDEGIYDVINEKHLPWQMKGRIKEEPTLTGNVRYDANQLAAVSRHNQAAFANWLSYRVLLLSRANSKWIYNMLNIEQSNSDLTKMKIALICRAVSVLDSYWLKLEGDSKNWESVDVKRNPLNEVIAQVALHGLSLTLQGSLITPELTTNGAYAKAWRRHSDGNLWLYKLGYKGSWESKIEVMCSNLLDKMNVSHVHYEAGEDAGKYVCMCPCITDTTHHILSGMEFIAYCHVNGLDYVKELMKLDSDGIYKMWIVDYLISNRDRHGQNWGLFYNPDTMELISTHPLFDHNNAFALEYMQDENSVYQFNSKTIKESAMLAMKCCDFHFTADITRDDFLTDRQWESFRSRARILGLM